jgi:hypothetical protein
MVVRVVAVIVEKWKIILTSEVLKKHLKAFLRVYVSSEMDKGKTIIINYLRDIEICTN